MAITNEAELRLIGNLISFPEYLAREETPRADDFGDRKCQEAFITLSCMFSASQPINLLTFSKEFGNPAWACVAVDSVIPSRGDIGWLSKEIIEAGRIRRIKKSLTAIDYTDTSDEILSGLLNVYRAENNDGKKAYDIGSVVSRFDSVVQTNIERGSIGIDTGFSFFREKGIYYQPGHMWVIGALPGVGKTMTVVQMLRNMPDTTRVMVFSTEMTEEQMVARILANKTGFGTQAILSGGLIDRHLPALEEARGKLLGRRIEIIDNMRYVESIENLVRLRHMTTGVDVVFIDYLQHVKKRGSDSRYGANSDISHAVQEMGKACHCTVVCISQIPTSAYQDNSDSIRFKGAGDYLEDCDLGIRFKRNETEPGRLMMLIGKNRHGPRGKQMLEFRDTYTRLEEIAHEENE